MKLASALAVLSLAACASFPGQAPTTSAPASSQRIVTEQIPYRPGMGTVIAAQRAAIAPYRLQVRMDNDTVQVIDTDATDIAVGQRVELSPDRTLRAL